MELGRQVFRTNVAAHQEFRRLVHARQVLSRNFHRCVDLGADPDEHRLKALSEQVVNRLVFTNRDVVNKNNASILQVRGAGRRLPGSEA